MDYMVQVLNEPYSRVNKFETMREAILFAIEQSQTQPVIPLMAVHLHYPPYGFRLQAIVRDGQVFMLTDYETTDNDSNR